MRAVVAGASGLVGSHLLPLLLADAEFGRVTVLVRRQLLVEDPKLVQRVVDFARLGEEDAAGADCIFCCLGTTAATAGSKEAQRAVDYEYPLALGRVGRAAGAQNYLLVSAMGADPKSSVFYSRLKGELERDLAGLGYPALTLVRPSLILGHRTEKRTAERISQAVMPWVVDPLLFGGLRKYHSIPAETIARALVARSKAGFSGTEILEYDAMVQAAKA
jgi:uncharacterized protein YbjT (DUF2867 family)